MTKPNLNQLLSCRTCDKYVPNDPSDPDKNGGCRAAPPVPMMVGVIQNRLTNQTMPNLATVWPGVGDAGDWCALHPLYEPPKVLRFAAPAGQTEPIPAKAGQPAAAAAGSNGNGSH